MHLKPHGPMVSKSALLCGSIRPSHCLTKEDTHGARGILNKPVIRNLARKKSSRPKAPGKTDALRG